MTIYTSGSWASGCTHTVILDENSDLPKPDGPTVAKKLHSMSFEDFCNALQAMIDNGYMDKEKADKVYNAYADKHES